jgi:polyhydroxyalkanoate synthesis regulator protein
VFAKAVESNDTPQDVKIGIGRAVMQLCAQYGDQMQSVLGSLPPDEATALSSVMKQ